MCITRVVIAAAFVISPIFVPGASSALSLSTPNSSTAEQDNPSDEVDKQNPDELQLSSGIPMSTTPSYLKPENAKLTWTPTGSDGIQDAYDISVSTSAEIQPSGAFSGEVIRSGMFEQSAEFPISGLIDATYYWQVRSCSVVAGCSDWSHSYPITIDSMAPGAPSANIISGQYEKVAIFTGTADVGSKVIANIGKNVCQSNVIEDGSWKCEFSNSITYGPHTATVVSSDEAGNISQPVNVEFTVKELFVSSKIAEAELPQVLNIVPINDTPENAVFKQPITVVDTVNDGIVTQEEALNESSVPVMSTDGGIVRATENGWQVVGLPWFVWLGGISGALAGWRALGSPIPRGLGAVFSL